MQPFIEVLNDGKANSDSFEAYLSEDAHFYFSIPSYGETEKEAVENLKLRVAYHIQILQSINWDSIKEKTTLF